MWMSTFARVALPSLRRCPAGAARPALRACRGPAQAAGRRVTWAQVRRQQTLVSASAPLPAPGQAVRQVRALQEERMVEVEWEDGGRSLFPFTWLRDNCQCPLCTLQSALARQLLLSDLDIHTGLDSVEVGADNKVTVVWPDQHTSTFDSDWLKRRCFSSAARRSMQEELFLNDRYYFDSSLSIPSLDFEEVLRDDEAALTWLLTLRRVGVVHLKGAPAQQGQVGRLCKRIGYHRLTFYGQMWHVLDKPMAVNLAYTAKRLSLHTDYPALHFSPGVQFVQCLVKAVSGGESEIVDGVHVAQQLRRDDPEAFRILSSTLVDFTDTGRDYTDFMLQSNKYIIETDSKGEVLRINFNNATRDSVLNLPAHEVQDWYRALKAFVDLLNRPDNVVSYVMEPGDMMTFDNWRLLHGRKPYASHPVIRRHLEGAYLDWDEVMSRLRILRAAVRKHA